MRHEIYKLARPGTIYRATQEDMLRRFGDGRPFRWRDIRDAYKRAWRATKGKGKRDIPYEPTLAVSRFIERTEWMVYHLDSQQYYTDDGLRGPYDQVGIWHSVVPEEQIRSCRYWEKMGEAQNKGYYYGNSQENSQCAACKAEHPNPYKPRRLGRYEVF